MNQIKTPKNNVSDNEVIRLRIIEQHEERFGPITPDNVAPDSAAYHKASHATLLCIGMVERHLKLDPVVMSDPKLFQHTQEALLSLMKLHSKLF